MNKTNIEWTDYTWNPVTGCFHSCRNTYCYNTMKSTSVLNRFGATYYNDSGVKVSEKDWRSRETGESHVAKKGEIYPYGYDPTFYPDRLDEPFKISKPSRVFVVDTGDLFGKWVPREWIIEVLKVIRRCHWHTFQLLTKNPGRLLEFDFPDNVWTGTSINTSRDRERAEIMKKVKAKVRYLSIEPLLGPIDFDLSGLQWLIIGAQTGKNPVAPETALVEDILNEAGKLNIPVFTKKNLSRYFSIEVRKYPACYRENHG